MSPIFVGRQSEQDEFINWVTAEPQEPDAEHAALVIGPADRGCLSVIGATIDECGGGGRSAGTHVRETVFPTS